MESILKTFDLTFTDAKMILVWCGVFIVLWQLLANRLFAPLIQLAEARERATTGAETDAHDAVTEAREIEARVEDRLAQVRVAGMKQKLELLSSARSEAQRLLEDAERDAHTRIAGAKAEIDSRLEVARKDLDRECETMVDGIVARLVV